MGDTFAYVGRRFLNLLIVVWIAGTLNFVIPRLMPGDPVEQAFTTMATLGQTQLDVNELKARWEKTLGLDAPVYVQYINYWTGIATLNLGISGGQVPGPGDEPDRCRPALDPGLTRVLDAHRIHPRDLDGCALAWPRSPRILRVIAPAFMVLSAMPYYLLAILLIAIFAIAVRIFPPAGGYSPTLILGPDLKSVTDVAYHALLPALSIILGAVGFWALGMRALMINVLGEDYITYAESKGLTPGACSCATDCATPCSPR